MAGNGTKPSVSYRDGYFTLDGLPYYLYGGELHIFRLLPEFWADRLRKMRRAYLNFVGAYLAWNWHEPEPGQFEFSGDKDLERFLSLADDTGLKVFIRPGPFICAEWDFGGLPNWLLKEGCEVRTTDENYLKFVRRYYQHVNPILKPRLHTHGGNIVLYQIDNEDWWSDVPFTLRLRDMVKEDGIDVPLIVNENPGMRGTEIIDTLDDYPLPWQPDHPYMFVPEGVESKLKKLKKSQPDKPMMYTELESGWFNVYGNDLPSSRIGVIVPEWIDALVKTVIGMGVNSINNYMFTGGTNYGYTQGRPNITSHDFMAPVGEYGQLSPVYYFLRRIGAFVETFNAELAQTRPDYDQIEGDGKEVSVFKRVGKDVAFLVTRNIGATPASLHFPVTLPGTGETWNFPRRGAYELAPQSAAILPFNVRLAPDGPTLLYTTSQLFRAFRWDEGVTVVLYERSGFAGEVMLKLDPADQPARVSGPAQSERLDAEHLCLNFRHQEETQVIRVGGKTPITLLVTTAQKAGRTWEVPTASGVLALVSNLYLMRDAEFESGRLTAQFDVEPGQKVEVDIPSRQPLHSAVLDGAELPSQYDPDAKLAHLSWTEDELPAVTMNLNDGWKVRPDRLPALDEDGWKPYQPWLSAEQSGFYHNGYLWYGTLFDASAQGGAFHLLLTRFQDDVVVYVNDQFAGRGNQHLELDISKLVRSGERNTLLLCVEVQGRDSWVAGDDHTGLIGPVVLYQEKECLPLTHWRRREMPPVEEYSLKTPPQQAWPDYDDTGWEDCLVQPGWDSQIHGRWRAKHFLWYRTKVAVPANWEGKRIWLDIGWAQDHTWVYVDGKLAGKASMFRRQGRGEFGFDLTALLQPSQEVTLVCCVLGKWVGRKGIHHHIRLCAADDLLKAPWRIREGLEGQRQGLHLLHYPDKDWQVENLPLQLTGDKAGQGVWWLRQTFEWAQPEGWDIPIGLQIEGLNCKALVYLNDRLVGRYMPPGPQTVFHLPAPWLKPANSICLAIDTEGKDPQLAAVRIAPRYPVRRRRLEIDLGKS